MVGFDEFGDCWGGYAGPSVDLQDAFGISALESPETRSDTDTRRKATMMMAGDVYDYFWQDKGGFDYLRFIYDAEYGKGGPNGDYQSPTGANHVKHLYGNNNDHVLGLGVSAGNMYSGLATHILRLSDIYLVYAEAKWDWLPLLQTRVHWMLSMQYVAVPFRSYSENLHYLGGRLEGTPAGTGLRRRPLV